MNKPSKIAIYIISSVFVFAVALTAGIALLFSTPSQPISEATFGGESKYTGTISDEILFKQMQEICNKNDCKKFAYNEISPPGRSFYISFYVDNNNHIDIEKYKNGSAYISLFQRKIQNPSPKTFAILGDLQEIGFLVNYDGGEKWQCNGKKLNKNNCIRTVQDVEPTNLIEFLKEEYR